MADTTKQVLLDIQSRLSSQLTKLPMRSPTDRTIWVVPDVDFVPPGTPIPFVTLKDGSITYTDMASKVRDKLMLIEITAYERHQDLETSVIGNTGQGLDGVLDLVEDIKTALNDFTLPNISGCQDYFRIVEEAGSLMAFTLEEDQGDIATFLQSKLLTFEFLVQETI